MLRCRHDEIRAEVDLEQAKHWPAAGTASFELQEALIAANKLAKTGKILDHNGGLIPLGTREVNLIWRNEDFDELDCSPPA